MSGDKLQGANVLLCATMTSELCASSIVPQTLLAIVEEGEGREPRRLHHSPSATTSAGRLQGSLSPHGPKMVFNTSWGYHSSFWLDPESDQMHGVISPSTSRPSRCVLSSGGMREPRKGSVFIRSAADA
ncbi:uncharacterized protein LOC112668863 isoform X4 [Canis lupus dingo]|uniref:uncharacterized protein LOC112668863 isoform X4 n=1 Tax=Canis lupus dingo TaxID=286419 RepID=UPI0020C42512|nr:uncharacterized protein LOC112668863 isoform X4 [Canis lupus dingo]